jgi:hypothetical protein
MGRLEFVEGGREKSTRRFQERGRNQDGDILPVWVSAHSSSTIAVLISAWQNRVPQIPNGGWLGLAVWVAWLAGLACLALLAWLGCLGVLAVLAWLACPALLCWLGLAVWAFWPLM